MSEEQSDLSMFEQEKQDARRHYKGYTLLGMAREMKELAIQKEEAENALKRINAWYDVLRYEAIPEKMDEEGMEKGPTYEGIGRLSLTADMFVSVKAGAKVELINWLDEEGLGDIAQRTINSSTLKAWVKDRVEKAQPIPQECLNITPVTRASLTKV